MMKAVAGEEDDRTRGDSNRILKVALLQFPVTDDKSTNLATCAEYIQRAATAAGCGAQLVVLPEIWNSPYATAAFPDYAEDLSSSNSYDDDQQSSSSAILSPSTDLLRQLARKYQIWIVGGSIPEVDNTRTPTKPLYYNTCQVFNPMGVIVAKHRKVHLFDIDIPNGIRFMESETLSAGNTITHFTTPQWGNIGLGICYDIRFPEYALALRHQFNCSILIYPGAFNMITGPAHWELLQRARAVDCQCYVLTTSPARTDDPPVLPAITTTATAKYPHYTAYGHSSAVSPWGEVIATRDESAGIVYADLDLRKVEEIRQAIPTSCQKRTDLYSLVVVPGSPQQL
jgi:omega-amidase